MRASQLLVERALTETVESVIDGWFGDQQHYPSVLSVHPHVNRGFLAFEVLVHPWAARRDATDGRSHPRYTDGYELSFCLLRADELDLEQTRWVRAAVEHVAAERGIDPYSALALMAHLFLLDVELARARAGVPSLLRGLGESLRPVGVCLLRLGEFEEATAWFARVVAALEEADRRGVVNPRS